MMYGYDGTIHGTKHLDVEIDEDGEVVSVWFRCCALPFKATVVGRDRAAEMHQMSKRINAEAEIHAIDFRNGDE
jgi:hypothetical protein